MKPLAFLLLLLHINSAMFIAQVDEQDVYDAKGQQVCDVDTLTDWLQETFSKKDAPKQHQDEDDDNARFFHILNPHHIFSPYFVLVKKPTVSSNGCFVPVVNETALFAGFFSIQVPPPKT